MADTLPCQPKNHPTRRINSSRKTNLSTSWDEYTRTENIHPQLVCNLGRATAFHAHGEDALHDCSRFWINKMCIRDRPYFLHGLKQLLQPFCRKILCCLLYTSNGGFLGFDFCLFSPLDFVLVSLLCSAGFPLQVVLMKPVLAFLTLADFLLSLIHI